MIRLLWKLMHIAYRLRMYRLAEWLLNRFDLHCDDPGSQAIIHNLTLPEDWDKQ